MTIRLRPVVPLSFLFLAFASWAVAQTQGVVIQTRLLSPISTKTSKPGDKFTLLVLSPVAFKDGIIEGHVVKSKGSGRVKGKSQLSLAFDSLTRRDRRIPIAGQLRAVRNSKGKENVDEEGRAIGRGSKVKDILTAMGLTVGGAAIGAATGGKKGATRGGAIGAAAAAAIVLSTKGPEIDFVPGTEFTLVVWQERR